MDILKQQIELKKQALASQPKQYKRRGEILSQQQSNHHNTVATTNDNTNSTHDNDDDSSKRPKLEPASPIHDAVTEQTSNTDSNTITHTDTDTTQHNTPDTVTNDTKKQSLQLDTHEHKHKDLVDIQSLTDIQRSKYDTNERYIYVFLQFILQQWKQSIDTTTTNDKQKQLSTYNQTKQYLKPLFTLLKHNSVNTDMLKNMLEIVNHCIQQQYIKANEYYLLLAIGRAAWPMGVTMVGIHERAGREKLHSDTIAHILNDETARKYIQSIKRLITVCATLYPNKNDNWINVKKIDVT